MFNLATNLESAAARWPQREGLVFEGRRWTFAELDAEASRVAHGLAAHGVGKGDHVALISPNRPEFITAYFGILKVGAVAVTVSALLRAREIAYQLQHSDSVAMIAYGGADMEIGKAAHDAFRQADTCRRGWFFSATDGLVDGTELFAFDELTAGHSASYLSVATDHDDTAVVLYTSGTTGKPKGAELTHANIIQNVICIARVRPMDPNGGKSLIALPVFHVMAQTCQMHLSIYNGTTSFLVQRFDALKVVRLLLDEGIPGFAGVPTMYRAILDCPDLTDDDHQRLKELFVSVSAGGSALAPELQREFMEKFEAPMTNGYGATETSPASCFPQSIEEVPLGSIGTAGWGIDLAIADDEGRHLPRGEVGELLVRGHCVMKGYYKDPIATADVIRDGWYHSGDLARTDEDGFVYIVGRKKEMIIRGGFNIYPAEVEAVLSEHPDVAMAAVVGVPHDTHGEEVKAYVTALPGRSVSADEVTAWARKEMAAHKYPRLVEVRDSLPLGPTGKVVKRALIEENADHD